MLMLAVLTVGLIIPPHLQASVSVVLTQTPALATVTNGLIVQVDAGITTNDELVTGCDLVFRTLAAGTINRWNTNGMFSVGMTPWRGCVPRLPEGKAEYYVEVRYTGGSGISIRSTTNTYTISSILDNRRQTDFLGWTLEGGGSSTNYYRNIPGSDGADSNRWYASGAFIGTTTGAKPQYNGVDSLADYGYIRSIQGAYIRAPFLSEGVGTLYFISCMRNIGYTASIDVQYTTNATPDAGWQTIQTLSYSNNTLQSTPVVINRRDVRYVRLLRTDATYGAPATTTGAVVYDNLALSIPPADVQLTALATVDPSEPINGEPVTVSCTLSDLDASVPTINRRLNVWYKWNTNDWVSVAVTNAQGTTFSGVIPGLAGGTNLYYFSCDFDGYYYKLDPDGSGTVATQRIERISGPRITTTNSYQIVATITRILGLSTNLLAFGEVATNAPYTRALTIFNNGNSQLTVSNITSSEAAFSVAPTNFTLAAAGGSTNVLVTFAPTAFSFYTGTLAVVCNRTDTGPDTVAVTGLGVIAEVISAPTSIVGPATGARLQTLSFEVTGSTNNYPDRPLQYRFDWGDGNAETNSFGSNVQTHAWQSISNAFSIRAQARSQNTPAIMSAWSGVLATVAITNTRIISVTGNLAFGDVVINTATTRTMTVSNLNGSEALTVSSISCPASVTAAPQSFVVPMGGSSNVTVTFTPPDLGAYAGTLTVNANPTSGSNTLDFSATGMPVEFVSAPTNIIGLMAGARLQTLSFTAAGATNNYPDRTLQYRFDWGDGNAEANSFGSATQTHAWQSLSNAFPMRAQARSSFDTNKVSAWSGVLATVAITNTRIISVTGSLEFGNVVINTTTTRTITVSNSVNSSDALMVSNITCLAADVTITPTNFTLAAGSSSNVMVTFTPSDLGGYAGSLIVHADQTSGNNTPMMTGTGIVVEVVSLLAFSGPANGSTNELITFSALADNNYSIYGDTVEYRFDWGDNRTSAWSSASSGGTNWPAVGNYNVSVQARCAIHTDKESAWYAPPRTLTIRAAPAVTFTPVSNGQPLPVSVVVADATACTLFYSPFGSTLFQSLSLTLNGGAWVGVIPPLNAGLMRYYVQYTVSGPATINWPGSTPYPTYLISASPGERRFTDFMGWSQDTNVLFGGNASTNYYRKVTGSDGSEPNRWYASGLYIGTTTGAKPQYNGSDSTANYGYIRSIQGSYIRSPFLDEGVGTLYFISCMRLSGYTASIDIQVTTSATPEAGWQTIQTLNYSGTAQRSTPIIINRRDVRYVRFLRTDITYDAPGVTANGSVVYDNISISIPATDITLGERLYNPGYPSRDQDVKVRCIVTDTSTNFPTVNRQVKCYYSWQSATGPFTATNMVAKPEKDFYEGTIPRLNPGRVYYYFGCDFDGYYFSLDPDGPGSPQGTNSERIAVAVLPTNAPASVRHYDVRRYQATFSGVAINANPSAASVLTNDVTLVADNTWQGLTLVKGITNLTWRFTGYDAYTNDALAFDPTPWSMGEDNPDSFNPPIAGKFEYPATNDMRAELDYDGFLLFRVNTDPASRDYIVKRAVYQNFDTPFWQASPVYFEESLGLYAMKSFISDFDATPTNWVADAYSPGDYLASNLETLSGLAGQDYVPTPGAFVLGAHSWAYEMGKAIADRGYIAPLAAPNAALNLSAIGRGRLWNTVEGFTPGIDSFDFTARASVDDLYAATYKGTSGDSPFFAANWLGDYTVTAIMRAREISPAPAYISTMVYYQPTEGGGGWGSFYEVRLVQITDMDAAFSDNSLKIQLYRWNDGASVPVEVPLSSGGTNIIGGQKLASGSKSLEITVDKTTVPGTTRVQVRYDMGGSITNWNANPLRFNDAGGLTNGGSVGFMTFDAIPEIVRLEVKTTNNVTMLPTITNWNGSTTWFMGGKRLDGQNRWQADPASGALWRPLPALNLGVYTAPSVDDLHQPDFLIPQSQFSITSLTPAPFTVPLKEWNKTFVWLQNSATNAAKTLNDLPIVVDNVALAPWRANTRGITQMGIPVFRDWTSWSQQSVWLNSERGWAVLEGWVNTSAGASGNEVQFERSRANSGLIQGLVSPVLSNGIGSIAFNYRTSGGKVVFAVERTASNGDQSNYEMNPSLQVVTNSASTNAAFYLPIRERFTGRIRVRLLPESDKLAVLKIDNLLVRDYPPSDETTWRAYNMLITSTQTNRIWEAQTGFLNNGVTNGTYGAENFSEHRPFIQSPKVGTGIGEIAFWYRVWDTNTTGQIEIRVAPELDTPEPWTYVTNFPVSNIDYQYFSMQPYDLKNKVLRIYSTTNIYNRVCLDNILMTEPVRAGYEIRSVTLTPVQPLENQSADVVVEIGRFIMNPSNIQVFVSYHVNPTNVWGYTNWWTRTDTAGSIKIELTNSPTGSRLYRTTDGARIPAMPVDTPVQFVAWGTHAGIPENDNDKIFQATNTFTNPAWYYPRNLNGSAGGLENGYGVQGWSPYYFVYSCAPGAVWVNEINYYRIAADNGFEYIELVGPARTVIGDWRIESIDINDYNHVLDLCTVTNGVRLPDDLDGWGFFVWGDPTVTNVDHVFSSPVQQNLPQSGGIRLVRSMGAWEQRAAYGPSRANLFPAGYIDAGSKPLSGSPQVLGLTGVGNAYSNFTWTLLSGVASRTPGTKNISQVFDPILPTFFTIFSVIGTNGSHSVSNAPIASIQVVSGGSTQIVYTADQWFRIATFHTNGVAMLAPVDRTNYVWSVTNVLGNISNNVTFYRPSWFITQIVGNNGTASPTGTLSVLNGASTSVVYSAAIWYRLAGLTTNGSAVVDAVESTNYLWSVSNVVGNISNNVTFYRPSWFITQIVGNHGTASPTGTLSVPNGAATSIVYTAADWYRIATLTTNGSAVTGVAGQRTNTLILAEVTADISNQVAFAMATPPQTGYTNVPTAWLAAWAQNEATPFDHDLYGLDEEYLLDTSPYASNTFFFAVSGMTVTNPNVYVEAKLLVDSAAHQHINGWLKLYNRAGLETGSWSEVSGVAVTGNVFNISGVKSYTLVGAGTTNGFFKAAITP